MKKKNVKMLLILLGISFCYIVFTFFISGMDTSSKGYIVTSNLGGFYCERTICSYREITNINTSKPYKIYQNHRDKGIFNLEYVDQWNFSRNGIWEPMVGDFLAISESLKAEVKSLEYEIFTPLIEEDKDLDLEGEKILLDIDNNGEEDQIIVATNLKSEKKQSKYISLLYIIVNGKKREIYEHTSKERDIPMYRVFNAVEFDSQKEVKLLINKGYYDNFGEPAIIMLEWKNGNIEEVS